MGEFVVYYPTGRRFGTFTSRTNAEFVAAQIGGRVARIVFGVEMDVVPVTTYAQGGIL